MKLNIEIEAEDALSVCAMFFAVMEIAVKNIGESPLFYSRMSRIVNDFNEQVLRKIPLHEFERIQANQKNLTGDDNSKK